MYAIAREARRAEQRNDDAIATRVYAAVAGREGGDRDLERECTMSTALIACWSCSRHVRVGIACPFCGASASDRASVRHVADDLPARAKRAAALALGATIGLAGCGSSTTPSDGTGAQDTVNAQDTMSAQDGTATDAMDDDVNFLPPYGVPPSDAGIEQ
jgi:hypothetical protein